MQYNNLALILAPKKDQLIDLKKGPAHESH